eukprot:13849038-Ditylum_brightwellii.AAC.1
MHHHFVAGTVKANNKKKDNISNEYVAISNGGDENAKDLNHESVTQADDGNNSEVVATDDRVGNSQSFGKEQATKKVINDNENNLGVSVEKKNVGMADAFSSPTKEQAAAQVVVANDSATPSGEADNGTSSKIDVEKENDEVIDDNSLSAEGNT